MTCVLGSMADVPKDLLDQINKLEDLFIVDAQKLKEVTDQFVSELRRGLGQDDATIVRFSPPTLCYVLIDARTADEYNLVHGLPRRQRDGNLPCSRHGWY